MNLLDVVTHGEDKAKVAKWTKPLAIKALEQMTEQETALLYRMAAARGCRVPVSELSAAFGLPAATAVAQDFPALSKFSKQEKADGGDSLVNPVVEGGTDDKGWYWMSVEDANVFRLALSE